MLLFAPELFCTVPVPGQCCFYLFTLLLSQRSEEGWQSCVPQFVVATYIDFTYVLEVSPGIPSLHCAEELSAYRDLHTKHTKELLRSSLCGCSASFSSQLGAVGLVALALTHTSGACLQPCPHWDRLTDQNSSSADIHVTCPAEMRHQKIAVALIKACRNIQDLQCWCLFSPTRWATLASLRHHWKPRKLSPF